jgi:hypothetical protein
MFNKEMKMKVRLYVDNEQGLEQFWRFAELEDCFGEDDRDSYYSALNEITKYGRVWIGGGAALAYLAMRA